ncbi:uncharacterized protein [Equus caballus]|uniref:uncharacterized protein isoform X3 n=1 Tax=Equus caballus TaxID=9796 RepID=UPI0038B27EDC
MESEHSPCSPGDPATHPCPAGHYCPGGSETHPGTPQACPEHTYLAAEGGQSQAECLPCPAGYHCSSPGLSSFEGHPCPPGHWCPGDQGAFLCPPGTFRTEPGASLWEDCELCPPGYYCPEAQLRGQATVFPIACRAGSECPAGAVAEVSCRAGSYCGPQTGVPPLCPGGYACPAGSSTYSGPGQLCEFPYYCPPGSTHPLACPGGSEALNRSGLRISKESCCHLCEAGTYRNRALDALPCQPCPAGFSCHQGASHCTCRGLNRVFQKSDGSCICQAGHESSDERDLQSDESDGAEDCQPQVAERCSPGDVRLAATRQCVSPQQHNCSSSCHPLGGELSDELGICRCWQYVSAEELCDARCLARAPQLSLAWGPNRELILSVKGEAGDSIQREVASALGPDPSFQGSARVHLVQCGPHGIFGLVISSMAMLGSLLGPPVSSSRLQRRRWTAGPAYPVPQAPSIPPHIPNPVICLIEEDVILFQLQIHPDNRPASHYPVYQKQHLFNSNPHWDFGAFRRLSHLVRETQVNFSRFVHQFLDPGTYVFRDNALPESVVVVSVKEKGIACGPGLSSVQPSSPYQLSRHGIVRHRLPTLGPDWAVITGVLLAVGLATALLTGLGLVLSPPLAQTCPVRAWRLRGRGLREPHVPADCVPLGDSLTVREDLGPQGSGEGASCRQRAVPRDTGEPHPVNTLEDFSVRTLYDKLEDQSLHLVAQLSKHRSDALAFYRGASQQLQGLKDFLQGVSMTERQDLGRGGDLEMGAKATARTDTGQREEWCSGHTAASPRVRWQHPLGGTPSMSPLGFQSKLDRMIAALASALSHARGQPARAHRKASAQGGEQPLPSCQQDPQLVSDTLLKPRPQPSDEEHQSASPQKTPGPGRLRQGDAKGGDTESPVSGHRHGAFPELQRKIWQVEDILDELNKEFFQLTAQALELQKEEHQPDHLPPRKHSTFAVVPSIFPHAEQEDRPNPAEAGGPDRKSVGTWALKSEQALILAVRRACLAQRIEGLDWELSLLLQVAEGSTCAGWSQPSLGRR